jgi:uncharacterized protein
MLYLDTSLLVAAYAYEPATDRALSLLANRRGEPLMISEWVKTEFAAAMSLKIRTKEIEPAYRARAQALFAEAVADSMEVAVVTSAHFRRAEALAAEYKAGLRAGDALHLAVASSNGAILCTLDKRLASAAKTLGEACRLI